MKRRDFIAASCGTAAAIVAGEGFSQAATRRVSILIPYSESDAEARMELDSFLKALEQLGWQDGRNLRTTIRWTEGNASRIDSVVKELVEAKPNVILVRSTAATARVLKEAHDVSVVFLVVSDPVGEGFVASMSRPGGNVTGFTNAEDSLGGKWVQLLKEIFPRIARVAVIFGAETAPGRGVYYMRLIKDAAASSELVVVDAPIRDAAHVTRTIESLSRTAGTALIITPDLTTSRQRGAIVQLANQYRLPAIYAFPHIVTEGGLMSYGVDVRDIYRRAGSYVDLILRGTKPGELPVQGPTKFELAINVKVARALGLDLSASLLARADQVFE